MKRLLFTATTIVLMLCSLQAAELDYPCRKTIEKGEFGKAHMELDGLLSKKPEDLAVLYAAACLYAEPANPNNSPETAYRYACHGLDNVKNKQDKETAKLRGKGFDSALFLSAIDRSARLAMEHAVKLGTPDAFKSIRVAYSRCSGALRDELLSREQQAAYKQAAERNTIQAFETFVKDYPSAPLAKQAQWNIHELAYHIMRRHDSHRAKVDYLSKYPDSHRTPEVLNAIYPGGFTDEDMNDQILPIYMMVCQLKPGDNVPVTLLTQRQLVRYITKTKNFSAAHEGFSKFINPYRDSCWLVLHYQYTSYNNVNNFGELYKTYPTENFAHIRAKDSAVIRMNLMGDDVQFINTAAPYRVAYMRLIKAIKVYMDKGKWEEALAYAQQFADAFGDDKDYKALIDVLAAPIDKTLVKQRMSDKINSKNGNEFAPVPSIDGKQLFFGGKYRKDNVGGEDIFVSTKDKKGNWGKASVLLPLSTYKHNESVEAVSADGTDMILFKSGALYRSRLVNNVWTEPVLLPKNLTISDWMGDVTLTSNGKVMLFTAETQLPYQAIKTKNIYVSMLDSAGNWSDPIDIGPTINSNRTDRMPFIHPDMTTLYFSSEGHSSIGELDVFKSTRLNPNSWTEWSEPVNLGKQVNSTDDDWGYKISTDGSIAYFSADDDIYMMNLPENMRPEPVVSISGFVTDNTGKVANVIVKWHNVDADTDAGKIEIRSADGAYFYVLQPGYMYRYSVDDANYSPFTETIDLRGIKQNTDKEINIRLMPFKQKGSSTRQAADD